MIVLNAPWKPLLVFFALTALPLQSQTDTPYQAILQALAPKPALADSLAEAYLLFAEEQGSDSLIIEAKYLLGLAKYYNDQFFQSNRFYKEVLMANPKEGKEAIIQACWQNIGVNYDILGNYEESIQAYRAALKAAQKSNDSLTIAQLKLNIGLLEIKNEDVSTGISYLDEAHAYFKNQRDAFHLGLIYQNYALASEKQNNWQDVRSNAQKALNYFSPTEHYPEILRAKSNIGLAYLNLGNYKQALLFLRTVNEASAKVNLPRISALSEEHLGRYYLQTEQWPEAAEALKHAIEGYQKLGMVENMQKTYPLLAKALTQTSDKKQAEHLLDTLNQMIINTYNQKRNQNYLEIKAVYELEDKLKKIQLQQIAIRNKNKTVAILLALLLISILSTGLATFLYLQKQRLTQSLFLRNRELSEKNKTITAAQQKGVAPLELQSNSTLQEDRDKGLETLFDELDRLIVSQKLFLDPELSLSSLSKKLNTNDLYTSKAINTYANCNFNTYINTYRIEEARQLLEDEGQLLENKLLSLKCGFQSYSTFFRVFKSLTGLSPTAYKKQILENKKQ